MTPEQEARADKTIEVRGLHPSTTSDAIRLFFENQRKSGGDMVDEVKVDSDNSVAYVTFHKREGWFAFCTTH